MPENRTRIHSEIRHRAQELRHPLTPAEATLWQMLRNRRLTGLKFRRQHPIGPFITDFYCAQAHLVIEIDGDVHGDPDQAKYDAARTEWLEERGYRVLRFQAREVDKDLRAVVRAIREACEARRSAPHPNLSPQGRG